MHVTESLYSVVERRGSGLAGARRWDPGPPYVTPANLPQGPTPHTSRCGFGKLDLGIDQHLFPALLRSVFATYLQPVSHRIRHSSHSHLLKTHDYDEDNDSTPRLRPRFTELRSSLWSCTVTHPSRDKKRGPQWRGKPSSTTPWASSLRRRKRRSRRATGKLLLSLNMPSFTQTRNVHRNPEQALTYQQKSSPEAPPRQEQRQPQCRREI